MHGFEEPLTASIPGEHPPGSIRPVRCRRQAYDQELRLRVPEGWHRSTPVDLVSKPLDLAGRDVFPMGHEPWTGTASYDVFLDGDQLRFLFSHAIETTPAAATSCF